MQLKTLPVKFIRIWVWIYTISTKCLSYIPVTVKDFLGRYDSFALEGHILIKIRVMVRTEWQHHNPEQETSIFYEMRTLGRAVAIIDLQDIIPRFEPC